MQPPGKGTLSEWRHWKLTFDFLQQRLTYLIRPAQQILSAPAIKRPRSVTGSAGHSAGKRKRPKPNREVTHIIDIVNNALLSCVVFEIPFHFFMLFIFPLLVQWP